MSKVASVSWPAQAQPVSLLLQYALLVATHQHVAALMPSCGVLPLTAWFGTLCSLLACLPVLTGHTHTCQLSIQYLVLLAVASKDSTFGDTS